MGLDFRSERLVGRLGGTVAQHHQGRGRVSWHFRWRCTEADRMTALITGTLGTLDRIGVLAQYCADEGEQWRWINALVRFPTCFW